MLQKNISGWREKGKVLGISKSTLASRIWWDIKGGRGREEEKGKHRQYCGVLGLMYRPMSKRGEKGSPELALFYSSPKITLGLFCFKQNSKQPKWSMFSSDELQLQPIQNGSIELPEHDVCFGLVTKFTFLPSTSLPTHPKHKCILERCITPKL